MNFSDFLHLLKKPNATLSPDQITELEGLIKEFPYFQPARALHLKLLQNGDSSSYNKALKETATYTTDREVLYDFINSEEFLQNGIASSLNSRFTDIEQATLPVEEEQVELEETTTSELDTDPVSNFEMPTSAFEESANELVEELQVEGFESEEAGFEDLPVDTTEEYLEEEVTLEAVENQDEEDFSESFQEEFMNSFHYETDEIIEEETITEEEAILDIEKEEQVKIEQEEFLSNVEENLVIEPDFELPQTEESLESLAAADPLMQSEYNLNFNPEGPSDESSEEILEEQEIGNEPLEERTMEEEVTEREVIENVQEETFHGVEPEFNQENLVVEIEGEVVTPVEEEWKEKQEEVQEKRSFSDWLKFTQTQPETNAFEEAKTAIIEDKEKSKKFELVDKFIESNPRIIPDAENNVTVNIEDSSKIDGDELMTETLANLYLEQKKYKKAIKAFKSLSLKYPEKSSFFAAQIEKAKRLSKEKEE